jgi:hypothetical protein
MKLSVIYPERNCEMSLRCSGSVWALFSLLGGCCKLSSAITFTFYAHLLHAHLCSSEFEPHLVNFLSVARTHMPMPSGLCLGTETKKKCVVSPQHA